MSWVLSDWQVELLRRGGLTISSSDGAVAVAELEAAHRELMCNALTTAEVAKLLQVHESEVQERREDRTLWAVRIGNEWYFSTLPFIGNGPRHELLRGLDQVFPALPESLDPLSVAGFLTTPQPGLQGRTRLMSPLEWLRDGGDPQRVVGAAEAVGWIGI